MGPAESTTMPSSRSAPSGMTLRGRKSKKLEAEIILAELAKDLA
jgi:hypothetical protein